MRFGLDWEGRYKRKYIISLMFGILALEMLNWKWLGMRKISIKMGGYILFIFFRFRKRSILVIYKDHKIIVILLFWRKDTLISFLWIKKYSNSSRKIDLKLKSYLKCRLKYHHSEVKPLQKRVWLVLITMSNSLHRYKE